MQNGSKALNWAGGSQLAAHIRHALGGLHLGQTESPMAQNVDSKLWSDGLMKSLTIPAYLEFESTSLILVQDEDVPFENDKVSVGPLLYWEGCTSAFAVAKPTDAEKITVTFVYDPSGTADKENSISFVHDTGLLGVALNDVDVSPLLPMGSYRVSGTTDSDDPSVVTVTFTPA